MVRLGYCWLMIESIVIPHGFIKWFYLSFYIHPCFLPLLLIFLWIRKLHNFVSFLLVFALKTSTFVITYTLRFFNCFFSKKQSTIVTPNQSTLTTTTTRRFKRGLVVVDNIFSKKIYNEGSSDEAKEEDEVEEVCDIVLSSCSSICPHNSCAEVMLISRTNSLDMNDQFLVSPRNFSVINDDGDGATNTDECNHGEDDDDDDNDNDDNDDQHYIPQKLSDHENKEEEVMDPFYKAYLQKMKWFDVLNHDRFFALEEMRMKNQLMSENNATTRRLAKSIEKDFELVYVAQSCLSWEALHHQFRKVEALAISSPNPQSQMLLLHNNVAGRFQKFQILLERFLEDERCGGARHSNFVHQKYYSLQTLLLVPHLSGYEEGGIMLNEGSMKAIEVLKAIEKCITTFWLYVKVDNKRIGWSRPTLEDPRYLDLLHAIIKSLRKKEVRLKEVEGKRKCWLRRKVRSVHSSSKNTELIYTKIDMKLVRRVLKLPIISTSQLKWCQDKLGNIVFNKDGKITRAHNSVLFPS